MKFSVDLNGKTSEIKIYVKEPYLEFPKDIKITKDILDMSKSYKNLILLKNILEKNVIDLENDINKEIRYFEDFIKDIGKILMNCNIPPIKK